MYKENIFFQGFKYDGFSFHIVTYLFTLLTTCSNLIFLHMQESLHNKNGKFVKNMMTETACTLFLNNKIDLVLTILAVVIKKNIVITWSSDIDPAPCGWWAKAGKCWLPWFTERGKQCITRRRTLAIHAVSLQHYMYIIGPFIREKISHGLLWLRLT